jgi:transcriptional regulator with XRE-family HTH domain
VQAGRALVAEIRKYMSLRGLSQRRQAKRANISLSTLVDILRNPDRASRHPQTLVALSIALDLHPNHVSAAMAGEKPSELPSDADDSRLTTLEHRLDMIAEDVRFIRRKQENAGHRFHADETAP